MIAHHDMRQNISGKTRNSESHQSKYHRRLQTFASQTDDHDNAAT